MTRPFWTRLSHPMRNGPLRSDSHCTTKPGCVRLVSFQKRNGQSRSWRSANIVWRGPPKPCVDSLRTSRTTRLQLLWSFLPDRGGDHHQAIGPVCSGDAHAGIPSVPTNFHLVARLRTLGRSSMEPVLPNTSWTHNQSKLQQMWATNFCGLCCGNPDWMPGSINTGLRNEWDTGHSFYEREGPAPNTHWVHLRRD